MDALLDLARAIAERHAIDPRNVVAHSDIAPERRQDPGELFDWARLAEAGHRSLAGERPRGLWGEGRALRQGDRGAAVRRRQERLRAVGYGLATDADFGASTVAVVRAFQRHFRQARVDGVIDASTDAVLDQVSALALPGDAESGLTEPERGA